MRRLLLAATLAASGCATAPQTIIAGDPACALEAGDKAWLTRAPEVWPLVSHEILKLASPDPHVTYVLFDAKCSFTSKDARNWSAAAHDGQVALPDGQKMPAQVTSFAAPAPDGSAMMVMGLPTVWRAGDVSSEMGLERLMYAVLAHEMTHTRQFPDYGPRIDALAAATGIGEDMTDDIIQDKFAANAEFAASVERERDLLFAAAAEINDATAKALAAEAQTLMAARRAKWLSGENASLGELEDIFLTMEGAGQFSGLAWLYNSDGGGLDPSAALKGMRRGKRWSQDLGLALFMALDRLSPAWPTQVFAAQPKSALILLASVVRPG